MLPGQRTPGIGSWDSTWICSKREEMYASVGRGTISSPSASTRPERRAAGGATCDERIEPQRVGPPGVRLRARELSEDRGAAARARALRLKILERNGGSARVAICNTRSRKPSSGPLAESNRTWPLMSAVCGVAMARLVSCRRDDAGIADRFGELRRILGSTGGKHYRCKPTLDTPWLDGTGERGFFRVARRSSAAFRGGRGARDTLQATCS